MLPIESPVAPIGELLPPMGWRDDTQLTPFSAMQLDGGGGASGNLRQEDNKQKDNQDRDLGEKPAGRADRPRGNDEPDVVPYLLQNFSGLSRNDVLDYLEYMYSLHEFFWGDLSPADLINIDQQIMWLVFSGGITAEQILSVAAIAREIPKGAALVCSAALQDADIPCIEQRSAAGPGSDRQQGQPLPLFLGTVVVSSANLPLYVAGALLLTFVVLTNPEVQQLLTSYAGTSSFGVVDHNGWLVLMNNQDDAQAQPAVVPRADFANPDPNDPCGNDSHSSSGVTEGYSRVGRWMSKAEYDAMKITGKVQESFTGTTHVAYPANASAFMRQAANGSYYTEFTVPTNSLKVTNPGEGWAKIVGPNSLEGRLAAIKGREIPQMPDAMDLLHLATKCQ